MPPGLSRLLPLGAALHELRTPMERDTLTAVEASAQVSIMR
jgi:hypothetical protein